MRSAKTIADTDLLYKFMQLQNSCLPEIRNVGCRLKSSMLLLLSIETTEIRHFLQEHDRLRFIRPIKGGNRSPPKARLESA